MQASNWCHPRFPPGQACTLNLSSWWSWGTGASLQEKRDGTCCYGNPGSWHTRQYTLQIWGGGGSCTRVRCLAATLTMTHRCTHVHTMSLVPKHFICTINSLHVHAASLHTRGPVCNRYLEIHTLKNHTQSDTDRHTLSKSFADPHISSTVIHTTLKLHMLTRNTCTGRQMDPANTDPQKYIHRLSGRNRPLKSHSQKCTQ